jgi:hypothetical protein
MDAPEAERTVIAVTGAGRRSTHGLVTAPAEEALLHGTPVTALATEVVLCATVRS